MHIAEVDKGMLSANDIGTLAVVIGQIAAVSTGYGPVIIAGQGQMSIASLARSYSYDDGWSVQWRTGPRPNKSVRSNGWSPRHVTPDALLLRARNRRAPIGLSLVRPVRRAACVLGSAASQGLQGRGDRLSAAQGRWGAPSRGGGRVPIWGAGKVACAPPPQRLMSLPRRLRSDGNDDLSSRVSPSDITERLWDLAQRVRSVDDGCDVAGFHQVLQDTQVRMLRRHDKGPQRLAHKR
jgi:hypothetical protein